MKRYTLETIVFLAGTITMVFELTGARALGPYFGTSIFVWTSLIGIIMGSLSIGYWLGGYISIKRADFTILSWIVLLASFFMMITAIGDIYILDRIVKYVPGIRLKTVVSTIILFSPASIFLGMVLPYSVKLKIENIKSSGAQIGNLFALSTIGSVLGTFSAGFVLVPEFGYSNILYFSSGTLIISSISLIIINRKIVQLIFPGIVITILIIFWSLSFSEKHDYIDVDTTYNRVLIYNTTDRATGRPIKMLRVNDENSSAMFTDKNDDLVFEVLKYYRLAEHFKPGFDKTMMIGGSGYAFPKDYLQRYAEATIDVIEIDPGLTELAKLHFDLPESKRLSIYHEDGRTFLNRTDNKYDVVFMDAYKSMLTIPFQLTTIEAVQKIHDILEEDGVVFANIISSLNEKNNQFLRAELATYESVFPNVYLFAVQYPNPTEKEKEYFQNIMLVGLKSTVEPVLISENPELNGYLQNRITTLLQKDENVLSDEYAPVEYFASKALN